MTRSAVTSPWFILAIEWWISRHKPLLFSLKMTTTFLRKYAKNFSVLILSRLMYWTVFTSKTDQISTKHLTDFSRLLKNICLLYLDITRHQITVSILYGFLFTKSSDQFCAWSYKNYLIEDTHDICATWNLQLMIWLTYSQSAVKCQIPV